MFKWIRNYRLRAVKEKLYWLEVEREGLKKDTFYRQMLDKAIAQEKQKIKELEL